MQRLMAFFSTLAVLASLTINIAGDLVYIRGAQGTRYFYGLYDNLEAWEARKEIVRGNTVDIFKIDVAEAKKAPQGQTAYAPKIHTDGIVIDRFYVETIPGYYLCGNLYASADPAVNTGPMPLVMLAHGHFGETDRRDRFYRDFQHLGAAFAQRGFLVVTWDMMGRGDDNQRSHYDDVNTVLQTWNSMKLLGYLLSPRFTAESSYTVDPSRVAVTGASGGGTQAIHMSLLDDRLTASIPVAMVSAYFGGNCGCENGINAMKGEGLLGRMKFKTNNCERIACFAPKPLLIISDGDDWTKRSPDVEYPYLRYVYAFYGAQSNVENFHDLNGIHDYSLVKRQAALDFLLRQWELPKNGVYDDPYIKDTYTLKTYDELGTFGASSGLTRPADAARTNQEVYDRITK